MGQLGNGSVANQANTTDGFAEGIGAKNTTSDTPGENVGDGGVVDLYHDSVVPTKSYIAEESAGYVLQENDDKIVLEAS